jgi:hypothetical protein
MQRRTQKHAALALLSLLLACSAQAEDCKEGAVMIGATRYHQKCMPVLLLPGEMTFDNIKQGRIVEMRIGKVSEIQELPKGAITSPIPGTPINPRPVK